MDAKALRECLDRADAMASSQARTIAALEEAILQYKINIELLHHEIGRLERMCGIVNEAP